MLRKKKSWALIAGIVLGTSTLTGVTTASADAFSCDNGEFCLWENPQFNQGGWNTYGFAQWNGTDKNYNNNEWRDKRVPPHDLVDILDNEASSVHNKARCKVRLYQHINHGGASLLLARGEKKGSLGDTRVGDNRASSHKYEC
ncbi:peptidase inhibitor family I36 protein [Streptomyces aureocirculatus]|uniref:peptidase inhibitor family I36 protein n=1 Tax=Streptomyces aureocirculatus TaxID=67275 RepID=UPI0004C49A6D|nr:peptidase inhibitor family I36 protein [Streptomyces aureocirculatus]